MREPKKNEADGWVSSANLEKLIQLGLVVCLLTLLLGTSIFVVCGSTGTATGYYLGYVGGALRRMSLYASIPLWLAAGVFACYRPGEHARFDSARVVPCVLFLIYALTQLLLTDPLIVEDKCEMLIGMAPILLLGLPLCFRKGCGLFWAGLAAAGLIFFVALAISGQLFSALHGEGFQNLTTDEAGRLDLAVDTITSSSILIQCVLAILWWLLAKAEKTTFWLVGLPICAALGGLALLTGSKGPVLSFLVALCSSVVLIKNKRYKYLLLLAIILAVTSLVGYTIISNYYAGAVDHLTVGLNDDNRQAFYQNVLESVPTLCGNGVGSWSMNNGYGPHGYVHNSLLEVYYEMGVVGLGIFLWAVGAVGWRLFHAARISRDPVVGFIFCYFAYGLTFSMVSGSVFSDTPLWLGLMLGCTRFGTKPRMGG